MEGEITPLMTARDVANVLKVTTAAVHQMTKRGQLKSVRFGKRNVRFRREDIEELIGQRKAAA